jgi:ketosteroid isomerase-like protein
MEMYRQSAGRQFYERQLAYLRANDVDGLIDQHYHDDAVLIRFDLTVRGRGALKTYFRAYLQQLDCLELISTDHFTETGDAVFLEATMKTALGTARVYDAFVLRDGKITHHFAGVIGPA